MRMKRLFLFLLSAFFTISLQAQVHGVNQLLTMANTLLGEGKYAESEGYFHQALLEAQDMNDAELTSTIYQNMALASMKQNRREDALSCARQAIEVSREPSESAQLTYALALMQVDSLAAAKEQLYGILHRGSVSSKTCSTAYRYLLSISNAIGEKDETSALVDSVCKWDDILLDQVQALNLAYYQEIGRKEAEQERRDDLHSSQLFTISLVIIILLVIIALVVVLYLMRRSRARLLAELALQRREAHAQLQEEKLLHHEEQINAMRRFLDKKVDTMQKIEDLKEGASQHFVMSDAEWDELEGFLDSVEDLFVKRLRQQFPTLSEETIHLMMLLRLRMPARSLAVIYGISEKSIKQKLFVTKEKVGLKGEKTSLRDFIQTF